MIQPLSFRPGCPAAARRVDVVLNLQFVCHEKPAALHLRLARMPTPTSLDEGLADVPQVALFALHPSNRPDFKAGCAQ